MDANGRISFVNLKILGSMASIQSLDNEMRSRLRSAAVWSQTGYGFCTQVLNVSIACRKKPLFSSMRPSIKTFLNAFNINLNWGADNIIGQV